MVNCKISVAMTTYNGDKYLKDQLNSIYTQSLLPDEVIICDDCSNDDTTVILDYYKNKYGLKYSINDKNLGFVKNFEKAVGLCSGEYIALSDQDDVWMPGKIETLYNAMISEEKQHPGSPVLVHHDSFIVDDNLENRKKFLNWRGNVQGLKNLLFGNPKVQGASSMFNSKLKELCFPLPYEIPLHDLYISYVCECFGFRKFISEPLMFYRQHSNNQVGVTSYSIRDRIIRYFNKENVLAHEDERKTLLIFANRFSSDLSEIDKNVISDYLYILDDEISIGKKVLKVLKNRFNCDGSTTKLILKIANSQSKQSQ